MVRHVSSRIEFHELSGKIQTIVENSSSGLTRMSLLFLMICAHSYIKTNVFVFE